MNNRADSRNDQGAADQELRRQHDDLLGLCHENLELRQSSALQRCCKGMCKANVVVAHKQGTGAVVITCVTPTSLAAAETTSGGVINPPTMASECCRPMTAARRIPSICNALTVRVAIYIHTTRCRV